MGDLVFLELATMVDLRFSASYLSRGRGRGIYTPSRNLTVAARLVRRLRPPGAETPPWSGNSGYTPEGLLELPTSSKLLLETPGSLRTHSAHTCGCADMLIFHNPEAERRRLRSRGPETPARAETPGSLRTYSVHVSASADKFFLHDPENAARRLRSGGPETLGVRRLWSHSGPTPHMLLVVPTSGFVETFIGKGRVSGP